MSIKQNQPIKINKDIKFSRVESQWSEVYRQKKYNNTGLNLGEIGNMERVDKCLRVRIELDLPKDKWDDKTTYFVYFRERIYEVIASKSDDAVIALIKAGFIGTQRLKNKENTLYNDLILNKLFMYRVQNIETSPIIVHCYESNSNIPTRVQYNILDCIGNTVELRDHLETYNIITTLAK